MAPAPHFLRLAFFGFHFALAARKSVDVKAKSTRNRLQVVVNDSGTTPSAGTSGAEAATSPNVHEQAVGMKPSPALLEHSSLVLSAEAFGFVHIFDLFVILAIVSVMVLCMRRRSENKESESENEPILQDTEESGAEVGIEERVERLSQTLAMRKLNSSMAKIDTLVEQRYVGIWWPMDSHTWGSTRLGWWESKRHCRKHGQALDGLLLREISEVREADSVENDGKPGVCITREGPGRADQFMFCFPTRKLASQYAEDLKIIVRSVKEFEEDKRAKTQVAKQQQVKAITSTYLKGLAKPEMLH